MDRLVRPTCLLLVLLGLARASEAESEPVVLHNGVAATPMADLTLIHERLRLHPYVLVGAGSDDNPRQRPAGSADDVFSDVALGCVSDLQPSAGQRLSLTAAVFQRQYRTVSGRDLDGGSLDLRYRREGPMTTLDARGKWDRSDDPSVELGRSLKRDRITTNLGAARFGEFTRCETRLRLLAVDYREDAAEFTADERDQTSAEWSVAVAHQSSENLELGLQLTGLGGRYRDPRSPYQDHVGWRAESPLRLILGEGLRLDGSVGAEARLYAASYRHDPAYDDQRCLVAIGQAGATWDYSANGRLSLLLSSGLADSITSNFARANAATATLRQQLDARLAMSTFGEWSVLRDAAGGAGPAAEADERRFGGNLTFTIRTGVTADLGLLRRRYDAGNAYEQTIFTVLVAVVL